MSVHSPFIVKESEARQLVKNQVQSGNDNQKCYLLQVSERLQTSFLTWRSLIKCERVVFRHCLAVGFNNQICIQLVIVLGPGSTVCVLIVFGYQGILSLERNFTKVSHTSLYEYASWGDTDGLVSHTGDVLRRVRRRDSTRRLQQEAAAPRKWDPAGRGTPFHRTGERHPLAVRDEKGNS